MARTKASSVEAPVKGSIPRERTLPKKRNPLLSEAQTPAYDELVSRRRLGRTDLQVKAEQIGTTNATKKENLGTIEYAYLGAPLPENLKGSETFPPAANVNPPEEYFMMRRSRDGFVSATGMFKVAFPWAKQTEEKQEREYLQTLVTTSADEQAGNIWINEVAALELADDYGIRQWIVALLDPAHPSTEPHKQTATAISPPPKFEFKAGGTNGTMGTPDLPPPATPSGKGSKRGKRSQSPSKLPKSSAAGSVSSPRKRLTKAAKEAGANAARAASATLQSALDTAASVADSESVADTDFDVPVKINGVASSPKGDVTMAEVSDDKVTVHVESTVETNGDIETTHTNVKVQMPADSPELPLPETTEEMIATAKAMVEEARKLEAEGGGEVSTKGKSKRKAADALDEDDEDEIAAEAAEGRELQPAKKAKLMEQQVRTQKVRSRALMGVAATLTIGAILPYFIGA